MKLRSKCQNSKLLHVPIARNLQILWDRLKHKFCIKIDFSMYNLYVAVTLWMEYLGQLAIKN